MGKECTKLVGVPPLNYLTSEMNQILGEAAINASVRYSNTCGGVRQFSIGDVLSLVPTKDRSFGKILYFLNKSENPIIEFWVFKGEISQWEDTSNWSLLFTSEADHSAKDVYKSLENVTNYLYELEYSYLDYNYAKNYFNSKRISVNPGACSSLRSGTLVGRCLDWYYSYLSEAVIHTSKMANRYGSVGIAGGLNGLTQSFIESQVYSDLYKILPFYLQDGVNDQGLYCSMNIVPNDKGITTGTVPSVEKKDSICSIMLVRYILDNFASANEAIEYLSNYVSIFTPEGLYKLGYDVHFMLADTNSNTTYILEFVNNSISVSTSDIMTNFFIQGVTFKEDGSVYTQADIDQGHYPVLKGLTLYGTGLERFNLLNQLKAGVSDIDSLLEVMENVLYTNTYKTETVPFWFSEYVSPKLNINLNLPTDNTLLLRVIADKANDYEHRSREDGKTWQTTHCCVYDLSSKQVKVIVQEDTQSVFNFGLKKN